MALDRLSPLDASFLRVESPTAHMHVAWKGRFAPPCDGSRPTLAALRTSVGGRLRHAARFRQRPVFPPPPVTTPIWVDDEDFAIERHVVALSEPDDPLPLSSFDTLADSALSTPLPRDRALWLIELAPCLADGSVGIVMKAHHALVDGKSAVAIALLLLDASPDAAPQFEPDEWAPRATPSRTRIAADALAARGSESMGALRGAARLAASPRSGTRIADSMRRAAMTVGEDVLRPAPSSFVNREIGPRRTLVHHATALQPLLDLRERLGVTLNDVALAAVAGALRTVAIDNGERPTRMKAMVPVSTRTTAQAATLGNRISFAFVDLPVDAGDAAARIDATRAATQRFKRERRAESTEPVFAALGLLPGPLQGAAARFAAGPRAYNLVVSNVPGPRMPVYLLGCELMEAVPVIPLSQGHALAVGIFTHADRIAFGFHADPGALPEVRALPAALSEEIEALGA